ncbi:cyclic nucleotide-gated cation channel beta-1-like [Penaeus chinensis]|uniref:cyclic nucleotide-gated cation channel beta-1-like n=1 Tax=Penaeus chinensis TaxID=139456 RepID=UPI001FB685F0|nr:cyclic nucleotide-gated cation channel beta-1-like [Penaeus chinensis]
MYTVPTINVASDSSSTGMKWLRYCASPSSDVSNFTSLEHSRYVTERIHNLVTAFSQRASRVKAQITQPPTPSTELSEGGEDSHRPTDLRQRLDSLMPELSSRSPSPQSLVGVNTRRARLLRRLRSCRRALDFPNGMEPHSRLYIWWLLVVSIAYVYNAWVIPLRFVFSEYQNEHNLVYWMVADYTADLIYVMDIVLFQSRIKYLDNGFWVSSNKLMRTHYAKSTKFRYDLIALLPLDFLYFKFGPLSIFRLPRLIKIKTFWEFFNRLDSVLSSPHAVRVVRTVLNMLYLIHLNTCAYYGFSKVEGIGSNRWVFQGKGNAYIRCFYFATKTATSIGKNPKPENEAEYMFMTASWLMGVFVFALLIGQIRDIVATATRNQNEYRKVMDQTQAYLHRLNLPPLLQERVRLWFTYTWHNQKTLDEMRCLQSLPRKMRTDIAINVHIQTLSKVQLFQDCDKALLRDLVLKLKPVLYLPGDYVCKKGEVGKEMYIVQTGQVLVMGGERGDVVLATLGEGSVFGEISLLALAGGNRRTANVRSRGFSSLFVLSKSDLQATIKDYPEAQEILKKKAK